MSRVHSGLRALGIATLLLAAACGASIRPGQAGLKYKAFRHPGLQKEVLSEGYYSLWGWNKLIVYDTTSQTRAEEVHSLTKDNLHVPVTVAVTFHPDKANLYDIHTRIGPEYYAKLVGPAFITLVRNEFSHHEHNSLADEGPIIEQTVLDKLRKITAPHHIIIDQVAISHIDYDDTVTQAISRKISTRQQADQKRIEVEIAQRDAEIMRTAAQGSSDAVKIQAEGEASAIVARGKAQAEAQEAINHTLTPRYLQFKAFDNHNASYFFVPTDKGGLPIIVDAGGRAPTR